MTHGNNAPAMRILIIEDEPMIALDLQEFLETEGFAVAGVAGRLDNALERIKSVDFDVAILDANLAGVSSSPVATALAAQNIPFLVLSGYSLKQQQAVFSTLHFVQKPFRPEKLVSILNAIGPKR